MFTGSNKSLCTAPIVINRIRGFGAGSMNLSTFSHNIRFDVLVNNSPTTPEGAIATDTGLDRTVAVLTTDFPNLNQESAAEIHLSFIKPLNVRSVFLRSDEWHGDYRHCEIWLSK